MSKLQLGSFASHRRQLFAQLNHLRDMPPSNLKICALIVGAGAVKNAWNPVIRALQPTFDFPLSPSGANAYLARLVYLLRWWKQNPSNFASQEFEKCFQHFADIRKSISAELIQAEKSGEIYARDEFDAIVAKFLKSYCKNHLLVTTNWDFVIDKAFERLVGKMALTEPAGLHIHGSVDDPSKMYLPTEVTMESYRTHEEQQQIGVFHREIWEMIEKAHRVVFYGLSLSPLDAELAQTVSCGLSNNNLTEIIIIDPNHKQVSETLHTLADVRRNIKILGYSPNDLKISHDYSITRDLSGTPQAVPDFTGLASRYMPK